LFDIVVSKSIGGPGRMSTDINRPLRVKSIGLEGVVSSDTKLSHVDGLAGRLVIGGYDLEELAGRISFEEACHLLWAGHLPNRAEYDSITREMIEARSLLPATVEVLRSAAKATVPAMDAVRMGISTLSLDDPTPNDNSRPANLKRAISITSRMSSIVATFVRLRDGKGVIPPLSDLSHGANYLYMLTGNVPSDEIARALETYIVTVIDHGMNASTFTARVIASTDSDMFSAVTGAVGALKGPLHGGAPGPVLDMLKDIKTPDNAYSWLHNHVKSGGRLMGFGHRIYKVRDPRADVLSAAADRLADRTGDRELYNFARHVEKVALQVLEEDKPGRNLKTNVEFYTALVLHMVGLSSDLFSPTFAVGRVGGWTAHVLEQQSDNRLIRPSSDYVGPLDLKWKPIDQR
jgi:citrate synthase